jgi:DNA-binding CsgD family transcriptional regulator
MALVSFGACLVHAGKLAEGVGRLEEALQAAETIAEPTLRAAVSGAALGDLSVAARIQRDFDLAAERGEAARRRCHSLGLDLAEARLLVDLGDSARERGRDRLADERYRAAIGLAGERGEPRVLADALSGLAFVAAGDGRHRTAALLFGAADGLRERAGVAMLAPGAAAATDRLREQLAEALGDDVVAAAWAEGRSLSTTQAIAVALAAAPTPSASPAAGGRAGLTRRELEVLRLLATGRTDREIAAALFIGLRTVNWHVGSILGKLGVTTRRAAVDQARAAGLI